MKHYKAFITIMIMAAALTACSGKAPDEKKLEGMPEIPEADADIDMDSLNNSIESLKNLDLDTSVDTSTDKDSDSDVATVSDEPAGDKTIYSYTDVYRDGNNLTVIPNGGLNGSTALYEDKDLNGFLDYVDSTVLGKGRTINRELFYDFLSIMVVDKDLSPDFSKIEGDMIMSLAMANNFYGMDVTINDCYLNANNAAEYHYHVTAEGKEDTWIVNYNKRTVFFNNGNTEYSSDMMSDFSLGVWLTAIEEYYDYHPDRYPAQ